MKRIVLLIPALLSLGACSTLTLDKARLSGVRKAAIVGFTVNQQMPKGLEWSLGASKSKEDPQWGIALPTEAEHATAMYGMLANRLQKDLKWKVSDRSALESAKFYREIFQRSMKGFQNRPPLEAGLVAYGAAGIVDPWPIDRMSFDERKRLLKDLGVDALAVATITIKLETGGGLMRIVGGGEFKPYARIGFTVYDGKQEDPVWRDLQAVGEVVEKGTGQFLGVTDVKALLGKSVLAAENSYAKLMTRYRDGEG